MPRFENYGQGGEKYSELLLIDPAKPAWELPKPHHFDTAYPGGFLDASRATRLAADAGTVGHARYDTHGDALRINELQSDINNHNIKSQKDRAPRQGRAESDEDYQQALRDAGWRFNIGDEGEIVGEPFRQQIPFALEDTWSDMLIKRLALEAARQGHRAIEVASPRAIAEAVGGSIENYEHFYGKVVPGALERLGRKMGGLVDDGGVADNSTVNSLASIRSAISNADDEAAELVWRVRRKAPGMGEELMKDEYDELVRKMVMMRKAGHDEGVFDKHLMGDYESAYRAGVRSLTGGNLMLPRAKREAGLAVNEMIARAKAHSALEAAQPAMNAARPAAKRYIMSDEMRRRLIELGVGASVLAPLLMQEER
jgi:hypothetical protein